jgi:hypothetical protein
MAGYERFRRPYSPPGSDVVVDGWWVLHPSSTLRGPTPSAGPSSQPNEQNISKREGFNLRRCFGPAPGREWWSLDAKNIELRIPAYESGEEAFIALFERENDPPYFGSNHLLIAHFLHPRSLRLVLMSKGQLDGRIFKKRTPAPSTSVPRTGISPSSTGLLIGTTAWARQTEPTGSRAPRPASRPGLPSRKRSTRSGSSSPRSTATSRRCLRSSLTPRAATLSCAAGRSGAASSPRCP